jgi:hypothetical protein
MAQGLRLQECILAFRKAMYPRYIQLSKVPMDLMIYSNDEDLHGLDTI